MSELDNYAYELPRELIAQQPLPKRSDARLMVVDRRLGTIMHSHVRDVGEFLTPKDRIVFNDTRVVPARLLGSRQRTGGRWEGLFLREDEHGHWWILGKTRGKLAAGETIQITNSQKQEDVILHLVARLPDGGWLARPETSEPALQALHRVGHVPLPRYIQAPRNEKKDQERYQTVFARTPGAVAAPTAGLHFTKDLLRQLEQGGIRHHFVTLHVGLDTFRPVKAARLEEHQMHSEWCELAEEAAHGLRECKAEHGRVVAVGTTVMRVLETAASRGEIRAWQGATDLFIRPGFTFRAVDSLLTNFHLPRTTLLVLVRTFGGDELIQKAYQEAIRQRYRFFSYGDAMLIL